ncbi:MAG: hypothetical protein MK193_09465 [Lentisphaeria bacterium]|nr:hypothetical protein [Lentisphaeria bacterium]
MFKNIFKYLPLIGVFLITSCIDYKQTIAIDNDLTGDFEIEARLSAEAMSFLTSQKHPYMKFTDATYIDDTFTKENGFKLSRFRSYDKDGSRYLIIKGKILDLENALESGLLGDYRYQDLGDKISIQLSFENPYVDRPNALGPSSNIIYHYKLKSSPLNYESLKKKGNLYEWNFNEQLKSKKQSTIRIELAKP